MTTPTILLTVALVAILAVAGLGNGTIEGNVMVLAMVLALALGAVLIAAYPRRGAP